MLQPDPSSPKNQSASEATRPDETMDSEDKRLVQEILQEAQEIAIRPQDRNKEGQLLVFPGGPVSALDELAWRVVRTPKFKEWFGDWEKPPIESFMTGMGSIYTYDDEGKTTRFKTATQEQNPRQDITVFVDISLDEEQEILHAYRNEGLPDLRGKTYVVEKQQDQEPVIIRNVNQIQDPKCLYLVIVRDGKYALIKKASLRPIKGYHPFDSRQYQQSGETLTERHLGNKVRQIKYQSGSEFSKVLSQNGEPRVFRQRDGHFCFLMMNNPLETTSESVKEWIKKNNLSSDPNRFEVLMNFLRRNGYDGFLMDGRPAVDGQTGKSSWEASQILSF